MPPREANYPPWMNGSSGEQTVENAAGSPISGHKIPETDTINVPLLWKVVMLGLKLRYHWFGWATKQTG